MSDFKVDQVVTISGKQLYAIHKHEFVITKVRTATVDAKLVKPSKHSLVLIMIDKNRLTIVSE